MLVEQPDEKSVITYVASLYNVFPLPSPSRPVRDNVSLYYCVIYTVSPILLCHIYCITYTTVSHVLYHLYYCVT